MKTLNQYLYETPQFITRSKLCEIVAISLSTLDRRQSPNHPGYDPNFPPKHYFGERSPRYDLAEVLVYLKNRRRKS